MAAKAVEESSYISLRSPKATSKKVRSPGLMFSFEPLDVCQPRVPLAGGSHAARD